MTTRADRLDRPAASQSRVQTHLRSGVAVIAPRGRLHHDTPVPDELYDSVRQTLDDGCSNIVVDFSGVTAIDATGVARLTRALASTCSAGGSLKLLSVPPHVCDLLEIIRLQSAFQFFDEESEAIRSFDSGTA